MRMTSKEKTKSFRYIGLDLSGAKNAKTTLATLEYYPKEGKAFLLDIHTGLGADHEQNSDLVLVEALLDHADSHPQCKIGVNVPLTLPPCLTHSKKNCGLQTCKSPEVKWMNQKNKNQKTFFTPYTQRPIELLLKQDVIAKLPEKIRFEMDETLGGNKAPLTARMHFLKRHLSQFKLIETLPKLSLAILASQLKVPTSAIQNYRDLEEGSSARLSILEAFCEKEPVFIYERDLKKLSQNLNAFDAFICAYTVLLLDQKKCAHPPQGFPLRSGWIHYPTLTMGAGK